MKSDSFREFVLDQLDGLGWLECRPMFGGHGIYSESVFFAILFKGRLFFKTDEDSRGLYLEKGMNPFRPSEKQTLKTYYEVPADVLEDPDVLVEWAEKAVKSQTG